MSIEEGKKPRKAPAKKATAAAGVEKKTKATAQPKVETAATKAEAAPKSKAAPKAAAKSAVAAGVPEAATAMTKVVGRPTHDQIAERAYSFYIERGWKHGHHEQDWIRAELELLARR